MIVRMVVLMVVRMRMRHRVMRMLMAMRCAGRNRRLMSMIVESVAVGMLVSVRDCVVFMRVRMLGHGSLLAEPLAWGS
jgi:hypothetical protein